MLKRVEKSSSLNFATNVKFTHRELYSNEYLLVDTVGYQLSISTAIDLTFTIF